jgi:hypothetical protein
LPKKRIWAGKLHNRKVIIMTGVRSEVTIYINELIRILKMAESCNSVEIAKIMKRIIYFMDKEDNVKTDLENFEIYKGDIRRMILPPKEYTENKLKLDEIDNEIQEYYK